MKTKRAPVLTLHTIPTCPDCKKEHERPISTTRALEYTCSCGATFICKVFPRYTCEKIVPEPIPEDYVVGQIEDRSLNFRQQALVDKPGFWESIYAAHPDVKEWHEKQSKHAVIVARHGTVLRIFHPQTTE